MKKYTISLDGYGAEITIGKVDPKIQQILSESEDVTDAVFSDELEVHWSEIDDIYHNFAVGDVFTLYVTDEDGTDIAKADLDEILDGDVGCEIEYEDKYFEIDEPCLVCCSQEKGNFFSAELELEEDFDITKLKLIMHEDVGLDNCYTYGNLVGKVLYDGEELDNYGGDTIGKSFDVTINF